MELDSRGTGALWCVLGYLRNLKEYEFRAGGSCKLGSQVQLEQAGPETRGTRTFPTELDLMV